MIDNKQTTAKRFVNDVHKNIQMIMEQEKDDAFHILDFAIQSREDSTVQHSMYWKDTWNRIYLNLNSIFTVSYKKALIKTLFHRTVRICTMNKLETELMNVKEYLKSNGYTKEIFKKYGKSKDKTPKGTTVDRKKLFLFNLNVAMLLQE